MKKLIILAAVAALMLSVICTLVFGQECTELPAYTPGFYIAAEPNFPLAGAITAVTGQNWRWHIAQGCDAEGDPMSVYATGPVDVNIGTQALLTGGDANDIITLSWATGDLPVGVTLVDVTLVDQWGARTQRTYAIRMLENTAPVQRAVPFGISLLNGY